MSGLLHGLAAWPWPGAWLVACLARCVCTYAGMSRLLDSWLVGPTQLHVLPIVDCRTLVRFMDKHIAKKGSFAGFRDILVELQTESFYSLQLRYYSYAGERFSGGCCCRVASILLVKTCSRASTLLVVTALAFCLVAACAQLPPTLPCIGCSGRSGAGAARRPFEGGGVYSRARHHVCPERGLPGDPVAGALQGQPQLHAGMDDRRGRRDPQGRPHVPSVQAGEHLALGIWP